MRQNGFYFGIFSRYTYLEGTLESDIFQPKRSELSVSSEHKLGTGVNLGFKIFFKKYYWGMSVFLGKYFIGNNDQFGAVSGPFSHNYDAETIIDMELLKIGYIFN